MVVFRFLAAVFLLVATIALVFDATPAVYGAGPFEGTTLSAHWQDLGPNSFEAAQKAVQAFAPWLWDRVIAPLLDVPTFIIFGALSLASGYAGRRRRAARIFVN
ncbi:hypothetical protein [Hyphomicrobium sp. CS1GBMeth3]|uniref:hypothetical protein n=1 Tax=Hyphomicrobium sp. CS1GBMeth3 TaxID=1892845 RepID=UPI000930F9A8|nr:hypothetical protein [Hyphomicrobium sp. CS1GBMeth3]